CMHTSMYFAIYLSAGDCVSDDQYSRFFFFKQKTAYDIGLGIPAEPLFRSILLLMPTLNFLPVWFALSLLRFRLPSRLPMMFILWMVAMMVVIIPSRTV